VSEVLVHARAQQARELIARTEALGDGAQTWAIESAGRLMLMTEIVFASNVMGSGPDWSNTRFTDEQALSTLRAVQRKLGRWRAPDMVGTRPCLGNCITSAHATLPLHYESRSTQAAAS
jgi:hypothetical protein